MIIKKFHANTETDAIMLAKEELGKDAIVMNIKTIKPKGIFKVFRKTQVEVTAAIDESSDKENNKDSKEDKEKNAFSWIKSSINEKIESEQEEHVDDSKELVEKINSLAMLLEEQMDSQKTQKEVLSVKDAEKQKDTEESNERFEKKHVESNEKSSLKAKSMNLIIEQLTDNEVSLSHANQIIDAVAASETIRTLDDMLVCVYQKIILQLGEIKTIQFEKNDKKPKVIFFVGTTGVGKTTTIAKLSSKLTLEEKKKIVIFTSDTYRIAAVEQIKTYANILSIPVEVIYEPEDIEPALSKYKNYDYILMDTAGRSHKNKGQFNDLKRLYSAFSKYSVLTYLVLSATAKYRDLQKITALYSDIGEYSLIFTKLDETDAMGNILNIKLDTGMPLSYMSYGQNVPDDIEVMNPQVIAKQLLGGGDGYGSGR